MNNKSILEFKELLIKELEFNNFMFEFTEVLKINVSRTAIIIKTGDKIIPVIYLDDLYNNYLNEMSMKKIIDEIRNIPKLDLFYDFNDFNTLKNNIFPSMINIEKNKEIIIESPYNTFRSDIGYIYSILNENKFDEITSIRITYKMLKMWGISKEELNLIATNNLINSKYFIKDITSMLLNINIELPLKFELDEIYCIYNDNSNNGANHLLNPRILEYLGSSFKRDFIILPSSRHEFLVIAPTRNINSNMVDEYSSMVMDVNESQVSEIDFLSNNILIYSYQKKEILDTEQYLFSNN